MVLTGPQWPLTQRFGGSPYSWITQTAASRGHPEKHLLGTFINITLCVRNNPETRKTFFCVCSSLNEVNKNRITILMINLKEDKAGWRATAVWVTGVQ